jgi:hypothetical protein
MNQPECEDCGKDIVMSAAARGTPRFCGECSIARYSAGDPAVGIGNSRTLKWLPIETAPRDGSTLVCFRLDWESWCALRFKTNHRIVEAHIDGHSMELAEQYFGDPVEMDDYDLAREDGGPTHWHPLMSPPCKPA